MPSITMVMEDAKDGTTYSIPMEVYLDINADFDLLLSDSNELYERLIDESDGIDWSELYEGDLR
jgi:hypothetical protein